MKPIQSAFYEINRFRFVLAGVADSEYGEISPAEYIERRQNQLETALRTAARYIHITVQFDPIITLTKEQQELLLKAYGSNS